MIKQPKVIAISSVSGGGKSVVVKKLAELLDNSVAIYFDDYETPDTYPKNPLDLMKNGVDFNVVKSPLLAEHLQALKNGETVTTPRGEVLEPADFIIYEGPLGYAQHETGRFIDFLVFIDTPLEIGLARRFGRAFSTSHYEEMDRDQLVRLVKSLQVYANEYVAWTQKAYFAQREIIRPASDLILDWEQPPEALAKAIIQALKEKNFL